MAGSVTRTASVPAVVPFDEVLADEEVVKVSEGVFVVLLLIANPLETNATRAAAIIMAVIIENRTLFFTS